MLNNDYDPLMIVDWLNLWGFAVAENRRTPPARQPLVRDAYLASRGIRMLPADGYLIFYTIQEETKTVHILRIVHGKREWNALLP